MTDKPEGPQVPENLAFTVGERLREQEEARIEILRDKEKLRQKNWEYTTKALEDISEMLKQGEIESSMRSALFVLMFVAERVHAIDEWMIRSIRSQLPMD